MHSVPTQAAHSIPSQEIIAFQDSLYQSVNNLFYAVTLTCISITALLFMINQYMLYSYTGCFIYCLSEFTFTLVWSENISVIWDGIYTVSYMCNMCFMWWQCVGNAYICCSTEIVFWWWTTVFYQCGWNGFEWLGQFKHQAIRLMFQNLPVSLYCICSRETTRPTAT